MPKKQKIIISVIFLGVIISIMIIVNFWVHLGTENLTQIFVALIMTSSAVLSIIFSSKTSKQIELIKVNVNDLSYEVKKFDEKFFDLDEMVSGIDKKQMALDIGFAEISEIIKHKDKIVEISKKIEYQTIDIIDSHYKVNSYLSNFIIQLNEGIALIIRNQFEYGFNDFKTNHFHKKITNHLNLLSEHANFSLINKDVFDEILQSISSNITIYIKEIDYIKNLVNGDRRSKFLNLTLRLTKNISNHSIEVYNKKKIA